MLVSSKDLVIKAQKNGYAVGAFNFSNLESLKAIVAGAQRMRAPIILQIAEGSIAYGGLPYLAALAKSAVEISPLAMAIHLDHGKTQEMVSKCIGVGFNSVMIDGSHLPLEENIGLTKQVVDLAHSKNIAVEGEIGQLDDNQQDYTNPMQAKEFMEKTGVDMLAVAIGSWHGLHSNEKLDLDLLYKIREQVNIPLVLHGGSGLKDDDVKRAIKLGIAKINIHTQLRLAFIKGMQKGLSEHSRSDDHREILKYSIEEMQRVVEEKIELFGSKGKV